MAPTRFSARSPTIGSSLLTTSVVVAGSSRTAARQRSATISSSPYRSSWSRKRFPSTTTRGRVRASASGSAPSSTSKRPSSARRAAARAEAIPDMRFAPAWFHASRVSTPRISAAIAVVVVLPLVAETSATPPGMRAARASTAAGSIFHRTFPGRVVPPPRPTARESAPSARAAAVSTASRTPILAERTQRGGGRRLLWETCRMRRTL